MTYCFVYNKLKGVTIVRCHSASYGRFFFIAIESSAGSEEEGRPLGGETCASAAMGFPLAPVPFLGPF